MRPDDDETLLGELRRVMGDADPVPDHVVAAAELALDWRTIDDELAELLHDSSELDRRRPRGVRRARARASARGGLTIELEVAGEGAERTLTGQLDPPARARIEVRHAGGTTGVDADARGRFIARGVPGRHREPALPARDRAPWPRRGFRSDRRPPPAALAAEAYRVVVDDPERARALAGEALRRARARRGRRGRRPPRARDGGAGARRRRHRRRAPRARRPRRPPRRPAARGRGADVARARAAVGRRDAARARARPAARRGSTASPDRGALRAAARDHPRAARPAGRGARRLPARDRRLPPRRRPQRRGARAVRPRRAPDLPRRARGRGGRPARRRRRCATSSASA